MRQSRPGILGWILVTIAAVALIVSLVVALNMVSRQTLDPMPVTSVSSF